MSSDNNDGRTTVTIDSVLREVLDKIVKEDPRYKTRTELVRAWCWDRIMELGYYDQSKVGQQPQSAPVEG